MILKNNYDECLTNLACSIRKYFGLDYNHNTLEYVDEILNEKKPQNVVTILFDGMGANILKRTLSKDDFFIKNMKKTITTVFPATTVAATNAIITGLNPVESGMLGWYIYYKDLDKIIATFRDTEKNNSNRLVLQEAINFREKYFKTRSIVDEINERNDAKGYSILSFGNNPYNDTGAMFKRIEELCMEDGKKYIYAYDDNPDRTMHRMKCDSKEAKDMIRYRNIMTEKLCNNLKDTVVFIIADHGHINVENIFLKDYPDIVDCLIRNTSIETRAVNFFVKDEKKEEFVNLFNKYFGNDFELLSKSEIIEYKLFGDGEQNEIFESEIGDFIAIATNNKCLLMDGDDCFKSSHAGYTDDEVYIPLIIWTDL